MITATITILFTEDNEMQVTQAESSEMWQEKTHRRKNGRDIGNNLLEEEKAILHGQTMDDSQRVEGGSSGARHSPGGRGTEGLTPQVTAGGYGGIQPAGGPHGGASSEEEDDWT